MLANILNFIVAIIKLMSGKRELSSTDIQKPVIVPNTEGVAAIDTAIHTTIETVVETPLPTQSETPVSVEPVKVEPIKVESNLIDPYFEALTKDIKDRIMSVIMIFETGYARKRFDSISIYNDARGDGEVYDSSKNEPMTQVTYGYLQTTQTSYLVDIVKRYVDNGGKYADELRIYIKDIPKRYIKDPNFVKYLKLAASDTVMQEAQDYVFETKYFKKALDTCKKLGIKSNLGVLIVFDSIIHSGSIMQFLRDRFEEKAPIDGGDEITWLKQYTLTRRAWLLSKGGLLAKCIYRQDVFLRLFESLDFTLKNKISTQGETSRALNIKKEKRVTTKDLSIEERAILKGY